MCPKCGERLAVVGVIEGLLDDAIDRRALLVAERLIEMGEPFDSRWQILECFSCDCHCRRYDRLAVTPQHRSVGP